MRSGSGADRSSESKEEIMHILGGKSVGVLAGAVLAFPLLTPTATSATSASQYVAIAFSRLSVSTAFVGWSNALASAERASLKLCRKYEKGCQGAVWAYNGWVAYASVSTARGGEGFAYGSTKSFVEHLALHYCVTNGGDSKCKLRTDVSTTPLVPHVTKGGTW
jgi:hypothetical protein